MKSPQLYLFAVFCLVSCTASPQTKTLPTAPEPQEFKLSSDAIRQRAKAVSSLGIVDLYADSIQSSRDEKGNAVHLAKGNVLLVKKSSSPIRAKADEILLNSDHAEVRGLAIVKRGEELHFGDAPESKIIIDGVQLRFVGPHSLKRLSNEPSEPQSAPAETIKSGPASEALTDTTIPVTEPKPTPKPVAKSSAKSKPRATSKPKPVTPAATKPISPAPKATAPTIDRSKLLQLMREPEN